MTRLVRRLYNLNGVGLAVEAADEFACGLS